MPIIDFHTHLGTSRTASMDGRVEHSLVQICSSPTALLTSMKENNITKSVVFSVPMLPHRQREANEEVLRLVSDQENLTPFAFLDPRLEETPSLLEELLAKGCKGIKLHPICHGYVVSSSLCYPTYEVARQHQIPVLIHTGWGEYGEIRWVTRLAAQFKELPIVIGHMKEYKDIFELVPKYENVAVETSYSTHPRRIAEAVRSLGEERVLYGSDFPLSAQDFDIYKIQHAPLSDGQKEKILYHNAARLLKLDC